MPKKLRRQPRYIPPYRNACAGIYGVPLSDHEGKLGHAHQPCSTLPPMTGARAMTRHRTRGSQPAGPEALPSGGRARAYSTGDERAREKAMAAT